MVWSEIKNRENPAVAETAANVAGAIEKWMNGIQATFFAQKLFSFAKISDKIKKGRYDKKLET